MRSRVLVALFLVLVVFSILPLHAQLARMTGIISDASGAVIPHATVVAVNQHTGEISTTQTNATGLFLFPSLKPGLYTLRASYPGFETAVVRDTPVEVAANLSHNFQLRVGSRADVVTVNGNGAEIDTSDATVSTVIDRRFVENIPLNGRSFQSLIATVPGTLVVAPPQAMDRAGEDRAPRPAYRIELLHHRWHQREHGRNRVYVGLSRLWFLRSYAQESALGTTQSIVSIDALQEFRATTSSYSAEYGRTPGGQFSFVTRSGTNDFHGTLFDYLRNGALDAKNWFDTTKLAERQNDFGGTLGGPVRIPRLYDGRDRTFFFFSYEGLRLTSPVAATLYQVPSNTLRATAPAALQPFLSAFPVSSNPDLGNGLADYTAGYSAPSSLDTTSLRLDHSFGDHLKTFARYSYVPSQSTSREASDLAQVNETARNVQTLVLGADTMFTPSLADELRFGWTGNSYTSNRYLDNFGGATPLQVSTAPGLSNGDWMTFFLFYGLYPYYLLEPQSNHQHQINLVDSFTETVGRHTLKYGIDYRRLLSAEQLPPLWEVTYFFDEPSVLANAPAAVDIYTQSVNMNALYNNFSAFLQDDWKVNSRLSISAGVRWELNPPPTDANGNNPYTVDQITDLTTTVAAPKNTPLWHTTYNNFAPRFGIAYALRSAPGSETVLRAGGGVFYDTGTTLSADGYYGIGSTGAGLYSSPFPATLDQVEATPKPSAAAPYNAPIWAYNPHLKLPYTGEWNAALEQQLGTNQTLTLNYVASAGRRMLVQRLYYPDALGNQAFSDHEGLYITDNGATSDYNSLQVRFNRTLAHGFQMLADYTWSHAFDTATTNFTVYQLERGPSDYDVRNNFEAALSYDIAGRYANRALAYALQHWSLDARISARSALPVDVLDAATSTTTAGTAVSYHPDYNRAMPLYVYGHQYPGGRAINYAAFTPVDGGAAEGNAGRNLARGFDSVQTDVTLRRDFPFTNRVGLQFRAEAYNLLNHPIYGSIYNSLSTGSSLFGQAYSTENQQLGGLSSLYQVGGPRSMQVALKLHF